MANFISEDQIELALLQRPQHLGGYDALNCFTASPDDLNDGSGPRDKREVILAKRLRAAVQRLNPHAPAAAQEQAVATLTQPCTAMSLVVASREVDALIRGGVPVEYEAMAGEIDTPFPQPPCVTLMSAHPARAHGLIRGGAAKRKCMSWNKVAFNLSVDRYAPWSVRTSATTLLLSCAVRAVQSRDGRRSGLT